MRLGAKAAAFRRLGVTPMSPFRVILAHRRLIWRLARQEINARFKGSVLGITWALFVPLLALLVYSFVFTVVLPSRWPGATGSADFALILFIGLIVFGIYVDAVARAPGLLLENVSYIKKVVFPIEVLSVVSVVTACVNAAIAFCVFLAFHLYFRGLPPPHTVLLPFVILPLAILLVGVGWFLSALGVYLRDLRHVVVPVVNLTLFLSPIFFPLSALPVSFQPYLFLNPITFVIEACRKLALYGQLPSLGGLAIYYGVAIVIAWGGLAWFKATQKGFSDVT